MALKISDFNDTTWSHSYWKGVWFKLTSFWGQFCTYVQCTVTMVGEVRSVCLTVCGQALFIVPWGLSWVLPSLPFTFVSFLPVFSFELRTSWKWLLMTSLSFSPKLANPKVVLGLPSLKVSWKWDLRGGPNSLQSSESIIWEKEGESIALEEPLSSCWLLIFKTLVWASVPDFQRSGEASELTGIVQGLESL